MRNGLSRKLWTTRDLQDAAAAGALVEAFESEDDDFLSEDEDLSGDEAEAAGVVAEDVLLDDDRLSVR
jgi:hypothetical protein